MVYHSQPYSIVISYSKWWTTMVIHFELYVNHNKPSITINLTYIYIFNKAQRWSTNPPHTHHPLTITTTIESMVDVR